MFSSAMQIVSVTYERSLIRDQEKRLKGHRKVYSTCCSQAWINVRNENLTILLSVTKKEFKRV